MLPLPGTLETPIAPQAGRASVLTLVLTTVLAMALALPLAAWALADAPWAEGLVRLAGLVEASWTLYADPVLFEPWQLWSWILAGGPWWLGLGNTLVAAVLLGAVERRTGWRWPLVACLAILPLGALLHMVADGVDTPIQAGAGALVTALTGLVWGLLRPARLTVGLGWWAVAVVGWIPLGAIALPWLGVLWLVLDGLVHGFSALAADAVTLMAGSLLGTAVRLRIRWAVT